MFKKIVFGIHIYLIALAGILFLVHAITGDEYYKYTSIVSLAKITNYKFNLIAYSMLIAFFCFIVDAFYAIFAFLSRIVSFIKKEETSIKFKDILFGIAMLIITCISAYAYIYFYIGRQ